VTIELIFTCFAACAFWVVQFAQLMALKPGDFPGPWDKYVWAAAFLIAPSFTSVLVLMVLGHPGFVALSTIAIPAAFFLSRAPRRARRRSAFLGRRRRGTSADGSSS
jgi:hypothetical protein